MPRHLLQLALAALLLAPAVAPASGDAGPTVKLHENDKGIYVVEASFTAMANPDAAWNVITDYNRIDEFVSSMLSSDVITANPCATLVRQKAEGSFLGISKELDILLQVTPMKGRRILFQEVSGVSFETYYGEWKLEDIGAGQVKVFYTITAEQKMRVPKMLVRHLAKSLALDLLVEVKDEIEHQSALYMQKTNNIQANGAGVVKGKSDTATDAEATP